jgi:hypothetical protein
MDALKRVRANTVEKRLLDKRGGPDFNLQFYILNRKGEYAGVSLYGGKSGKFAVCTENGPETLLTEPLISAEAPEGW